MRELNMTVFFKDETFNIKGLELGKLEIDNRLSTYTNMTMDHTAAMAIPASSSIKITLYGLNLPHAKANLLLREIAIVNKIALFELNFSDNFQLKGEFIIKRYELVDEYTDFQQYSLQLISAGKINASQG